ARQSVCIVMKKFFLSMTCALAFATIAFAIPQTFFGNGNGFFGAAGQQFEDAAVAAFGPGGQMKGEWAPVRAGATDEEVLKMTAVVFGVPATKVTRHKSGGHVEKYRVLYTKADDAKRAKQKSASTLQERVTAAVRTYTGASEVGASG